MNSISKRFIEVCPKTGTFRGFRKLTGFWRVLFPILGSLALVWIVLRVVTKPTRITYPCVKAAMPLATGFVGELIVLAASGMAYLKSRKSLAHSSAIFAGAFFVFGVGGSLWISGGTNPENVTTYSNVSFEPNKPVGNAKGIFPGRVVWVYDSNAVNQNCNSSLYGHAWFKAENNNQSVVDGMVSAAIRGLTGQNSDSAAWNVIFTYYNNHHGKANSGYQAGEKIFIKINATSGWFGNYDPVNLEVVNNSYYGISETSPAIVLSVLRQLVNVVGVSQSDIYVGDPLRHIYAHCYALWHGEFSNVHYLDHEDSYASLGREWAKPGTTPKVHYSDHGTVLNTSATSGSPVYDDCLYSIFDDAAYVLDIPMLKGHKYAGVTMFAKNNFGSQTRGDASHLHNGLVAPPNGMPTRFSYHSYRVLVDLMGSTALSGKHLCYLMDALWSTDEELGKPKKFMLPPFNNRFMSSIFASFDPVAIECVGYDFLRNEFTAERNKVDGCQTYIQMPATDDYMLQAADTTAWPAGINYDPDNSGSHLTSLGVYEHWNDSLHKQYSYNLGKGQGIELIQKQTITSVKKAGSRIPAGFTLYPNFPNPFNPSTTFRIDLKEATRVRLSVHDASGKLVDTILDREYKSAGTYEIHYTPRRLSSGVYLVTMRTNNLTATQKMVYLK